MSCRPLSVIVAIIGVGSMLLDSPIAMAQAEENLIDLGAVAPGKGINNNGQVVLQNYWYSQGTLTPFPNGFTGNAINASGHIAGTYGIYYYGTVTALPTIAPGTGYSFPDPSAVAINDSGAVTIEYAFDSVANLSALYSNGTLTTIIPTFGCNIGNGVQVTAQAINDSGQITGGAPAEEYSCNEDSTLLVAYIYEPDKPTTDLGITGAGNAINASGEVTGVEDMPATGAFLYSDGKVTLLPNTANCSGNGINTSGFIVGTCNKYAFFYNDDTTIDLSTLVQPSDPLTPYFTLTDARGINDSGLVIVNGIDSRDKSNHAYLFQVSSTSSSSGSSSGGGRKGGGSLDSLSLSFLIGMLALRRLRMIRGKRDAGWNSLALGSGGKRAPEE